MAKTKQKIRPKNEKNYLFPPKYADYVYPGALILAIFIFLGDAIFGGGFATSDNAASLSFVPYLERAEQQGDYPHWIPYIFSGMPSYAALLTTGERTWDVMPQIYYGITRAVGAIFDNDAARVAMFYVFFSIGMYLLMRSKKFQPHIAFFTSFAATFSTGIIVWIMIGHNTKPMVFAMLPYIFILMEKLREKFSLLYAALLIFAVHLMMEASHIQMIFYAFCAFGIYLLVELISRLISKQQPMSVLKVAGMLIIAGTFAFMMSSDRYLSTMEYTEYSTRGSAPIVQTGETKVTETGGHDYEYATMWSFSPSEIITFILPNYFGFGKLEYSGPATGGREVKIHTYWGQKPFEDVAPYMGIGVLALAILGAFLYWRKPFVMFLLALCFFAILLSFGYTLPVLYDIFYYNVPSFNKFRAPSMVLAMVQFAVPILAGFGLAGIMDWRKKLDEKGRKLLNATMIASGVFLLLGVLFNLAFKDAYLNAVASSKLGPQINAEIMDFIWSQMISDWYVTAFIAILFAGAIYLFVKRTINPQLFIAAILLLLFVDLWRVSSRPMETSDQEVMDTFFHKTDLIDFLQQDKSKFRIAQFGVFQSPNMPAYWFLESVGGYHSAKLRVYQDMLDVADRGSTSDVSNPFLWNLLNVKYIITTEPIQGYQPVFQSKQQQAYVYLNQSMLPRAFFANKAIIEKPLSILNHLKNGDFNPRETAYFEEDHGIKIDPAGEASSAQITDYGNHHIKLDVNSTGNNLLILSEVYYPLGWKAFIDGEETEIYKTNFVLRSIVVPEGKHTVEFRYESDTFKTGKALSISANIITFLALGGGIFIFYKRKRQKGNADSLKSSE